MAVTYPTSLDAFSNPSGSDKLNHATAALKHGTQHADANDAVEALEAKVGITSSTPAGSAGTNQVLASTGTGESAWASTLVGLTLTSPVLTTPQINDTSSDHQYVFAVSELAADRTVTLPLLTGADTFVFEAHAQTLTNKTLTAPVISTIVNTGTLTLPTSTDTLVGRATTDTLTNKTLTSPTITGLVAQTADPPTAGQLTAGSLIGGRAHIDVAGGVPSLADDYNVSGIVDDGVGLYTVSWDLDFANDDYTLAITAEGGNYGSISAATVLVGSAQVRTVDAGGANVDTTGAHIIAVGDQ